MEYPSSGACFTSNVNACNDVKRYLEEKLLHFFESEESEALRKRAYLLGVYPQRINVYENSGEFHISIVRSTDDTDTILLPPNIIQEGKRLLSIYEDVLSFLKTLPTNAVESTQFWCSNISMPKVWYPRDNWWGMNRDCIKHEYPIPNFALYSDQESEFVVHRAVAAIKDSCKHSLYRQSFITSLPEDPWVLDHVIFPHEKVIELQKYIHEMCISRTQVDITAKEDFTPVKPLEGTSNTFRIPLDMYGNLDTGSLTFLHTFLIRIQNKFQRACIHLLVKELTSEEGDEDEDEDEYGLFQNLPWQEDAQEEDETIKGLEVLVSIDKKSMC